jgi:hypothetical protein
MVELLRQLEPQVWAAGAMLPGGESPGEAFSRKFDEVMSGGSAGDVTTNNLYDN